jgi:uncharacterized protein
LLAAILTNSKMKRIYIILLVFLTISCTSNKKHIWILDNEHDLTQVQIDQLDSLFRSHERKTTNEIALVTTPDYGTETSILFFAVNFGRKYGVGKKGKDNGVVIAFSSSKRETMISTGYGTEKVLKDEIAKKIIDSLMIPLFKQGKTFDGLWEGSKAVVNFLERPENKIR